MSFISREEFRNAFTHGSLLYAKPRSSSEIKLTLESSDYSFTPTLRMEVYKIYYKMQVLVKNFENTYTVQTSIYLFVNM